VIDGDWGSSILGHLHIFRILHPKLKATSPVALRTAEIRCLAWLGLVVAGLTPISKGLFARKIGQPHPTTKNQPPKCGKYGK